jgi:hypothetical protein
MAKETAKILQWKLGPISLDIDNSRGFLGLRQQTLESNLLYTLARARIDGVSRCALDLIFQYGQTCVDCQDALQAYSEHPLENPPPEYLDLFNQVDWNMDRPSEQARAIILAGSKKEAEKALLLRILGTLGEDFRDGALYAASSFPEHRFIEAVSKIAMSVTELGSSATGEMGAFITCYNRWIERGAINLQGIGEILRTFEKSDSRFMRANRLLNYILCPNWDRLPYLNERHLGREVGTTKSP